MGRIRVGADADLVLFDPATVIDRAGYGEGESMIPPDGIPHVIVNGKLVVRDGELTGDRPGRVLRRTRPIPGEHVHHGVLPGTGVDDLQ
jgi:N-acyl-D-aspartate/D-glutamate deacylase